RAGEFDPAPEEAVAELFLVTDQTLAENGYTHYEVSNFARIDPAAEEGAWVSRHNCKYWSYRPYLGFGPAAHSFLPPRRSWNHCDLARYLADVSMGRAPREGMEELSAAQQMTEIVMLGLRTKWGVELADFRRRFGAGPAAALAAAAEELIAGGLLSTGGGRLAPTLRGMLYLDTVTASLLQSL
nr:hypothetical protein [Desulfobacterales bacterium]